MVSLWTLRCRLGWLVSRTQVVPVFQLQNFGSLHRMSPGLQTYKTSTLPVEHSPRAQGRHLSWCLQEYTVLHTQKTALALLHSDISLLSGQEPKGMEFLDFLCTHLSFPTCLECFIPKLSPKKIPLKIQLLTLNTWVGEPEIWVEAKICFCQVNVVTYVNWS